MPSESPCPCQSGLSYATCCEPFHLGKARPATAEQLMRSRYSAYVLKLVDYLVATTHPDARTPGLRRDVQHTAETIRWTSLTIVSTRQGAASDKLGKVEFTATYEEGGRSASHHEHSRFRRYQGGWTYLDAKG